MTGAPWTWRLLAAAAAFAAAALVIEVLTRFSLDSGATPRRTLWLWVAALVSLAIGAPSAVGQLRRGASGRARRAVACGFAGFDLLGALVLWRLANGGDALGSRLVVVAAGAAVPVLAAGAWWAATARPEDLGPAGPS